MNNVTLLQKDHKDIPDFFTVKIHYLTGKIDELEVVERFFHNSIQMIEFITRDNLVNYVPFNSIQRLEFDKNFTKLMQIAKAKEAKNNPINVPPLKPI